MDSEDSRDAGDAHSSSSSSSSSSSRRSRRSSSSDRSDASKKNVNSPPHSPKSQGPRSPSPESPSQSSIQTTTSLSRPPRSPSNLSGAHSDINSPENSMPNSPSGPRSPEGHKSPSEVGSNIASPEYPGQYSSAPHSAGEGPKTPCSPSSSAKSAPNSPEPGSRPVSPDSASHIASSTSRKLRTGSQNSSRSPDRNSSQSPQSSSVKKSEWSPKEKWRRHTKAEQKMVPQTRERSGSESSQSSSSTYNKRNKDTATEEISEGEMESDQDDHKTRCKSTTSDKVEGKVHNMSHEDLSDVSDLDSIGPEESVKESKVRSPPASPESKQDASIYSNNVTSTHSSPKSSGEKMEIPKLDKVPQEKTSNTEDGEEQLDFEAEEGECVEPKTTEQTNGDTENKEIEREAVKAERRSRGSSLEEGEVSDEAERRPEESEPRPVCRFFSRGACTWGVSCRFLHPGVTDKGNYSMFEVIRGVPPGGSYPPPARDVAPPESAWERGLRTAKEMVRIANKRKEQDMDFEEKKLHLSVGGVVHDPDAELAYAAAAVGASPPPQHDAPPLPYRGDADMFRPPPYGALYRGRYPPRVPLDERERFFEHERGYERERERERFYERPPIYDERPPAPDDVPYHKRRVRPSREVIVQRAEVERREGREGRGREVREAREVREGREVREAREVREVRDAREGREARDAREGRDGRGDEWADPWMRAEPAARRRRPVSSEDSYSSSSSSNSSSRSSRSPGARRKRRASSSSRQRLSPSVIVRERRLASARATAMNPPAPRRRAPSPAAARLAANPPPPANHAHVAHRHKEELDMYGRTKPANRGRDRKYSRSSSSGSESSSSSSESESESRSSSTSGSSGARRARHARLLNAAARPRLSAKSSAGLAAAVSTAPSKKEAPVEKEVTQARKRPATSPVNAAPAKKSVSRREELLKQLKAVEDAIARKRSKI